MPLRGMSLSGDKWGSEETMVAGPCALTAFPTCASATVLLSLLIGLLLTLGIQLSAAGKHLSELFAHGVTAANAEQNRIYCRVQGDQCQ